MVTIDLLNTTPEDIFYIQQLQKQGLSDKIIQQAYENSKKNLERMQHDFDELIRKAKEEAATQN